MQGASKIIGVDINENKAAKGKAFGMTHFINPKDHPNQSVSDMVRDITDGLGVDYCFECTGIASLLKEIIEASKIGLGTTVLIGAATDDIPIRSISLINGRTLKGTTFGGVRTRSDLPIILRKCMNEYSKDTIMSLRTYSDDDHAVCQDTRRSTSGSAQFLGDKHVSWSSKKQKSTAISSTEAEYIALSRCLENGIVELYFVQTEYQLADIFTKPFPRERFNFLIEMLGMKSMSPETLKSLAEEEMSYGGNSWCPVTTEEKVQKKNDVKYKDAKTLFAAIQIRFGGNEATKKTLKTLLKKMYENFSTPSTESLDSIFNRLQKIISQLSILGENISQEDLNLKFLRSLPSEWNTHVMVWRNKPDLGTMSFDDLYNNFKIVEQEVKITASSSSSSSSQNMAFVSSPSSTNKVNTSYGVSTANTQVSCASTQVSTANTQVSTANLSNATIYAFLANQPNRRTRRFFQKTSRKITINGNDTAGYDKSRNKNQDSSRRTVNVEETSSKAMVAIDGAGFDEELTNMALMAFSDSENRGLASEFNLATYKRGLASVEEHIGSDKTIKSRKGMGFVSYNVVPPPHTGLFSPLNLDLSYSGLEEFQQPKFEGYGLDQGYVDSGCSRHMTGNMSYLSDFKEFDRGYVTFGVGAKGGKNISKGTLKTGIKREFSVARNSFSKMVESIGAEKRNRELGYIMEDAKSCHSSKETGSSQDYILMPLWKDGLLFDFSLKNVSNDEPQTSLVCRKRRMMKVLDKLIGSQITDKSRKSVGFVCYNAIPPPHTGLFSPPNLDLSYTGLEEFQKPEFKGYGPKTSKSVSEDISNEIEFVTPKQQEKLVRKPVKYAEMYRLTAITIKGKGWPKAINTTRPNSAVVNAIRANQVNVVKASACWVWRPTKLNSASITLKRHNYVDARGISKSVMAWGRSQRKENYCLDRKSTTGGCQFLGCRLISWQCKKQTVVATSSTEAEYVAAASCCGQGEGSTHPVESHHTPTSAPSTLQPLVSSTFRRTTRQEYVVPQPRSPTQTLVADKAASTSVDFRY
ncbi:ribonuclease H-like domain-containing protein [Tanacetum coccineum]